MNPEEADNFIENTKVNLLGYTSTSKSFNNALYFAIEQFSHK